MPKYQLFTVAELPSFDALRGYIGRSASVCISGEANPGLFSYDETDTSSADDGADTIVGNDGRRWIRISASPSVIEAAVAAVGAIEDEIVAVAGISTDVTAVADNEANINAVAGNETNINTVAADSTDIGTVATDISNVRIVAGDVVRMDRVAAYTTEIGIVAAGLSDVEALAAQIEAVDNGLTLLGDHAQGLAIDATSSDTDNAVKVLDLTTPANDYTGSLLGFVSLTSISFATPKLCLQEDGTLKYQPHNEALRSNGDTTSAWTATNLTPTLSQTGPDGTTTDGTLLTVSTSTTNPRLTQSITVIANTYRRHELVVKAGTAPFVYIEVTNNGTTRRAWFNTSTLAWATVDSGLTSVAPSSTKEDGTAWATGWRSIAVYGTGSGGTTDTFRIGVSDSDGGTSCTLGRTVTIAQIQSHRGVKRLEYLATTTASRRGIPYDWTDGGRSVRFDIATAYKGRWGDDLTNAVWTASNITATLNAVGPHGAPCSTLTATAVNGTIFQAVTSSGTSQNFHAWVRRKTGTGAISVSLDNGSNYTDITDDIGEAGGDYRLVYLQGFVANPTVGFKIATSGDEIEVALANVSQTVHVPPPAPSAGADFSSSSDVFNVPFTAIPNDAVMTFYADVFMHESSIGSSGVRSRIGFFGAGNIRSTADLNALSTEIRMEHTWNDGVTNTDENWGDSGTGRIQVQHRYKSGDCAMAVNGNAAWWNAIPGSYTFTSFQLSFLQSMWLRRLLVVPEDIDDDSDDLRLMELDQTAENVNSDLLASAYVAKVVHDSTGILRIPATAKLYERGDIAAVICTWGQRYTSGYNLEAPQRMMQRRGEFDRSTNTWTWWEDEVVSYQPATWTDGASGAGVQGYTLYKLEVGPYRGRLLRFHNVQETAGGSPDQRNFYLQYSDDNGENWSASVKVVDKATFIGGSAGFVGSGENSTIFQIKDPASPHYGRLYLPLNANNQNHYAMWSDEFKVGATLTDSEPGMAQGAWSRSTTPVSSTSGGIGTLTEPALTFYPNNSTLVMLFRNSAGGDVGYAVSTDYGVTFGTADTINGDSVSWNVNCGLIQDDPTGKLGLRGRLILARSTLNGRLGHKVQSTKTADLDFAEEDNYRLYSPHRFVGYCPLLKLFENDNIYLCMAEHQPTVSSNINTSQMLAVFRY